MFIYFYFILCIAWTNFIGNASAALSSCIALLGGLEVPVHRVYIILEDALTIFVKKAYSELRL